MKQFSRTMNMTTMCMRTFGMCTMLRASRSREFSFNKQKS